MLTDEQMKQIQRSADIATTCLTVVTIHVTPREGASFTVEAMPYRWLETAQHLARLDGVRRIFASHASVQPDGWWGWQREVAKRVRKAGDRHANGSADA